MLDADLFAAHLVLLGLADSTVKSYRCLYQRWADYAMGVGRSPQRPDPLTVRAWAAQLSGSRSLLAQARAMMGHLCRLLEVEDCAPAIPMPRQNRRPRSRALSSDQAHQLAAAADKAGSAGLAVLVGLFTAARRGEIASLAWERVDFDRGEITFDRTKVRDLHTVPMHPALARRLELRHVPGELWVFPGRHGGHVAPAVVWEWTIEVAERAGLGRITPHQLRHTVVGAIYERGRDLLAAQNVAGHTDPAITARYATRSDDQVREAIDALDWLGEAG